MLGELKDGEVRFETRRCVNVRLWASLGELTELSQTTHLA